MKRILCVVLLLCFINNGITSSIFIGDPHKDKIPTSNDAEIQNQYESSDFWISAAQADLERMETTPTIEREAKNIIFYLADGVSAPTVTASRIMKGQKVDHLPWGEEGYLYLDTLPFTGASATFCADVQVADSACAATALLSGAKTNFGTLGVTKDVNLGNCTAQAEVGNHLSSLLAWAQAGGKAAGIVTTTRVTHASPAATYAHSADRHWENDARVRAEGGDPSICPDIAHQLIFSQPGQNMNVILGGGRLQFLSGTEIDPESGETGLRTDDLNLIDEWKKLKSDSDGIYVTTKDELQNIPDSTDFLLGLFAPSHLGYLDQQESQNDPSLEEMVASAVQILSRVGNNGFVLFVEGGRIDHAHHEVTPQRALWEMIEFDKAVKKGDDLTEDANTLIIVTSDHANVMHFAGYPGRGGSVLGPGGNGNDDLPYNTLGYANGPGQVWMDPDTEKRTDISQDNFDDVLYRPPSPIAMEAETHGGEDVPIFAKGPYAHYLGGVHQQSYIPHVAAFAACIGDGATHCNKS